jgi:hypothetical protein
MLTERQAMFGVQPRWGLSERLLGDVDDVAITAFPCAAAAGSALSRPRRRPEQIVLGPGSVTKTNGSASVCLKGSKTSAENMEGDRSESIGPETPSNSEQINESNVSAAAAAAEAAAAAAEGVHVSHTMADFFSHRV